MPLQWIPSTAPSVQSSSSVAMTTVQASCWSPHLHPSCSAKLLAESGCCQNGPYHTDLAMTLSWECPSMDPLSKKAYSKRPVHVTRKAFLSRHLLTPPSYILFLRKTEPLTVSWSYQCSSNVVSYISCSL